MGEAGSLPPSLAKSSQITGHMKGMVDGYVVKYEHEEAEFKESDAAMAKVVGASHDQQAKVRAINERQRQETEHEETLRGIAGFIRTLDVAVQSMGPNGSKWK